MTTDLHTTNVLLGIMAAVSVLEAMAVVSVPLAAFLVYRRMMQLLNRLEERHVTPAAARINAILDDVKAVTSTVKEETGRADRLVSRILAAIRRRRRPKARPSTAVM